MRAAADTRRAGLRAQALLMVGFTATGLMALSVGPRTMLLSFGLWLLGLGVIARPTGLPALVVAGQVLLVGSLLAAEGPARLWALPAIMGLIGSAELVAALGRLDGPAPRATPRALAESAEAAGLAGALCGVVLLIGQPAVVPAFLAAPLVLGAIAILVWSVLRG